MSRSNLLSVSTICSSGPVTSGEGKGWAKGRTAATDMRVARNAASHRGLRYQTHLTPEHDHRYRTGGMRTLPLEWSEPMAYVVGLMATDGNLSPSGRHLAFGSADKDLVETLLSCLGRPIRYSTTLTRAGNPYFRAQFGDVRFYSWLGSVGLTPRKSLTLGPIDIPDEFLPALLRGLFEGDGNIRSFVHRPTPNTYPNYRYERLWVFFNSASCRHLEWVRDRTGAALALRGYLETQRRDDGRHDFYRLKFGKRDSITLLRAIYPNANVPKLERKWKIWDDYARRNNLGSNGAAGGT